MRSKLFSAVLTAVLTFGVVGSSLYTPPARASGFPTVDIAALIQRIMSYVTELQQYATELTQTSTEISQLVQLYTDYEQTLREYEHFLRQIRGLQHLISNADWLDLMRVLAPYYGVGDFAAIPDLDVDSATWENDVRTLLSQYTTVPAETADLNTRLSSLGLNGAAVYTGENSRLEAAYARQMDVYRQVSRNEDEAKIRDEKYEDISDQIRNLGDESDVATLQVIATEMQMLLNQQQAALRLQNQQLLNTELPSAQRAADRAGFLDREIRRVEQAMASPAESFTVDMNGL